MKIEDLHYLDPKINRELTTEEMDLVGDFLWKNFIFDLKEEKHPSVPLLIKPVLIRMICDQGAHLEKAPHPLLSFFKDEEVIVLATHLYVAIQLIEELNSFYTSASEHHEEYAHAFRKSASLPKAFDQANPYILRYHVFALHNRMHELLEDKDDYGDEWKSRCIETYREAKLTMEKVEDLLPTHPAFEHFLKAYSYYTLAMSLKPEQAKHYWKDAYYHFLMTEATQKEAPRDAFIITLGQGLYKDMPFDNLEGVKEDIGIHLTKEEIRELRAKVELYTSPLH